MKVFVVMTRHWYLGTLVDGDVLDLHHTSVAVLSGLVRVTLPVVSMIVESDLNQDVVGGLTGQLPPTATLSRM